MEFAEAAARFLGRQPRLQTVRLADVTLRAPRPKYCALSNAKLAAAASATAGLAERARRSLA